MYLVDIKGLIFRGAAIWHNDLFRLLKVIAICLDMTLHKG
jgi:hypothetical protein